MDSQRSTPERMNDLLDKEDIREVMLRYADGLDRRDESAVSGCFTEDVHAVFAGVDYGSDAATVTKTLMAGLTWKQCMHFIGNQLVTLDGDRARMVSYAVAYIIEEIEGKDRFSVSGLRYYDDLVRTETDWRIQKREMLYDWTFQPEPIPPTAKVTFSDQVSN